jgi:F-type H+-transporting ATPase subunit gamma
LPFGDTSVDQNVAEQSSDYLFEPDPAEVLKHLLPRIIESQIYQTILESEAS